ncbi:SRPBCC family protein [Sphingomonas oryzagri]|uniref:SRPBCC domain-containing protein n=1 Tax=Sphingomonas oryzagri TaxID=3042314 RepID=A0ABT6N2S9_9SPHN|nr:SRPBCC domain-containing protein [Sphingomonas oryzagri]MDH7639595.1 SRPBCC domain-containing protein [Sphingomonas oryzagri]
MAPEFRITRRFAAPRDRVWEAWTRPEQLARWFGPKGVTTTVLSFDLRPGGGLHARMESADGGVMWARFVYREVVAPETLVWEHGFADEAGEFTASPFGGPWPLRLLTNVRFEEEGDATRLTLTWVPLEATAEEEAAFAAMMESMTGGWSGSFEQLDAFLADGA